MNGGILVDTHILLWTRIDPERLTVGEQETLISTKLCYVSAVCLWELALLMGRGRIETNPSLLDVPSGFDLLPILPEHCKAMLGLPMHHRDPFDRMLVAQAQTERLPLLTRDRRIAAYGEYANIIRYPDA